MEFPMGRPKSLSSLSVKRLLKMRDEIGADLARRADILSKSSLLSVRILFSDGGPKRHGLRRGKYLLNIAGQRRNVDWPRHATALACQCDRSGKNTGGFSDFEA